MLYLATGPLNTFSCWNQNTNHQENPLIFIFMATLSMVLLYNPCLWFKVFLHCIFVVGKSGLLYVALIKRITVCLYVYVCIYSDIWFGKVSSCPGATVTPLWALAITALWSFWAVFYLLLELLLELRFPYFRASLEGSCSMLSSDSSPCSVYVDVYALALTVALPA